MIDLGFKNDGNPWEMVKDGNAEARDIFRRHYSYLPRNRPSKLIVGPGEKMVLLSVDRKAIFIWRKFIDDSGQTGVNCAAFRNEGTQRSSDLILAAERIALIRWPGQRLYTFVNASRVQSSNPGYCFQKAGWRKCGTTKKLGLVIMEKIN
jgi:hypothetical protein